MNELKFNDISLTIPTDDPQDPGFDVQINYVATRDPTSSEPLVYNGYPFLPLWWQNVTSSDSWATYNTNNFWLCVNNTANANVWWRMVFDSNILSIINSIGWEINTNRTYSASGISLNTARKPSSNNDTFIVASINQNNTLLTTTSCTAQISPDNTNWITVGSIGDTTGVVSNKTSTISFIVPISYYYRLESSGSGSVTLVSCTELSM